MRPIILVVDPPDPETLSTRKLLLESAKYNVLTAFTGDEAEEIARKVQVDASVVHERVGDGKSGQIVENLKKINPNTPVILVSPHPNSSKHADKVLNSHDPLALLEIFVNFFGVPDVRGDARETHLPNRVG